MKETSAKIRAELKERGVPRSSYSIRTSWNIVRSTIYCAACYYKGV